MTKERDDSPEPKGAIAQERRVLAPPKGGVHADALAGATQAFNDGDFWALRRTCRAVAADSEAQDDERAFADELIRRTAVDPAALIVGVLSSLLILTLYLAAR